MTKNLLLQPQTLQLYKHLSNLQTNFFDTYKTNSQVITKTITHPKMLGSSFLKQTEINNLRQQYENEIVSTVLTQLDLQKTAFIKHGKETQNLLYSRTSLEQSTRYLIAKLHAERYLHSKAKKIADLGCGIGIDTFAISQTINKTLIEKTNNNQINQHQNNTQQIEIIGYEIDKNTYEIATHNLSQFKFTKIINENINNINFQKEKFEAIYTDPARRKNGKRLMNPNQWSPPLETIYDWIKYCPNIGAKLAPGIEYKNLHPESETNWISINSDLVEASIWFGTLKKYTGKTATVIKTNTNNEIIYNNTINFDQDSTLPPKQVEVTELNLTKNLYITEIDPAILRANGLQWVAKRINAKLISQNISYLISEEKNKNSDISPLIKQWKIIDFCPLKTKKINQLLQTHNISNLEIKKRGVDLPPDTLRKTLKLKGNQKGTIILTRYQGKHIALLVQE